MANLISKISVKTLKCVPAVAKAEGREIDIARIYGVARALVFKESASGDTTVGLAGDFEGVNLTTGEVFGSGVAYLPSGIAEMFTTKLEGDNPAPVQFALTIAARPDSNAAGYSYVAKPVLALEQADPLAELRASMQLALAPPAETQKDEASKSGKK